MISVLKPGGGELRLQVLDPIPPLFIGTSREEKPANNTQTATTQASKQQRRHRRHFCFTLPLFCLLPFLILG